MKSVMVDPNMVLWAVERSGYEREIFERKYKKLLD